MLFSEFNEILRQAEFVQSFFQDKMFWNARTFDHYNERFAQKAQG
jgi:hypothetical protein